MNGSKSIVSPLRFRKKKKLGPRELAYGGTLFRGRGLNPFETHTPWTVRELLFVVPMTPVVAVRIILLLVVVPSACLLVVFLGLLPFRFRTYFRRGLKVCARLVLLAFGYWRIEEEGLRENGSAAVGIICGAPHVSLLDVFYFAYRWMPTFVAKKDVRDLPVMGFLGVALGALFIDRNADPETKAGYKQAISDIASNPGLPPLILFPEGTCTNGKALITFKRGTFEPGLPILPVCLEYSGRLSPAAVGRNGGLLFLLRLMYQWSNQLSVRVLPVYSPSDEEKRDAILFSENVQKVMGHALGVESTRHSLADMWFYQRIVDDELPEDVFQFVFADLYDYFDLRNRRERREFRQVLSQLLGRWSEVDRDSDGAIERDEFFLCAQRAGISELWAGLLFTQFDIRNNSKIDFLELAATCFALQRLSEPTTFERTVPVDSREIRDAFRFYRGGYQGVHRDLVVELLVDGCGIELSPDILDSYYNEKTMLDVDGFERFYMDYKEALKGPFQVASALLIALLDIPDISKS